MRARLRQFVEWLADSFWLLPGCMVLLGVLSAVGLVALDGSGLVPRWLIESPWLYNGGATGARTLLGTVASSTIGVAGTAFSITIASLSLAAGQMGPRLLRNFTRDRGNQFTLGALLGTFCYALMVLRSVRTQAEGDFVPHLALSVGIGLAFLSVATLIYFVGHMASRINVDTVIELVARDVRAALLRLTADAPASEPADPDLFRDAASVADPRHGYLQHLDTAGLADWAARNGAAIRLLVRPGDYVFPGVPIALVVPPDAQPADAIRNATALGQARVSADDLEYAIRQLVEVAVRALSPGINDPHTAIVVIDRLGSALCDLAGRHLPGGTCRRDGRVVLVTPTVGYDGLTDAMFHEIRQNARGTPAVLIRLIEVLAAVLGCEPDPQRVHSLARHAKLVLADASRDIAGPDDLGDIQQRHARFEALRRQGVSA